MEWNINGKGYKQAIAFLYKNEQFPYFSNLDLNLALNS